MSSTPALGPGSGGMGSGRAMARILQLLNVCFHGFHGLRRRRGDLLRLASPDQRGDTRREEQNGADDERGSPHRQYQRQGGHGGGDDSRHAEERQQSRDAEQARTDSGVFGGLPELLLRQPHLITDQP